MDLTELFHIHRAYELKRKRLQRKASKRSSLKRILEKYSRRERNRAKDTLHKLATSLTRELEPYRMIAWGGFAQTGGEADEVA